MAENWKEKGRGPLRYCYYPALERRLSANLKPYGPPLPSSLNYYPSRGLLVSR